MISEKISKDICISDEYRKGFILQPSLLPEDKLFCNFPQEWND